MTKVLDSTVLEYRILMAVQPIFASALHWSGNATPNSHPEIEESDSASGESDESSSAESSNEAPSNSEIRETRGCFQAEINSIQQSLKNIPPLGMSEPAFQNCVQKMSRLLKFLENLVKDDILKHTSTSAGIYSCQGLSSILPTSPPSPSRIVTAPPMKLVRKHRYKRLEAMEMVLTALNEAGQDSPQICRDYICLPQSLKRLNKGITRAQRVNMFLVCVADAETRSFIPLPEIKDLPVTQWKNQFAWSISNLLFRRLGNTLCDARKHEAKFQLDGLRLNESSSHPLVFDMFLSPCEPMNHWQEIRCTSNKECK